LGGGIPQGALVVRAEPGELLRQVVPQPPLVLEQGRDGVAGLLDRSWRYRSKQPRTTSAKTSAALTAPR
jgi:hypothetical protein